MLAIHSSEHNQGIGWNLLEITKLYGLTSYLLSLAHDIVVFNKESVLEGVALIVLLFRE